MNAVIEAGVATGGVSAMASPVIVVVNFPFAKTLFHEVFTTAPASIIRFFSNGKTSNSAVSPDFDFMNGGMAVA